MQSDNLESIPTSIPESPQHPVKMTLSENNEDCSLKLATQASTDDSGNIECYPQETKSSDEINLEDDIEKVEVSSVESSENNEEAEEEEEEAIGWTPPITNIATVHPEENSAESIKTWFQRISAYQKKLSNETVSSANNLGSEHNNFTTNNYARQTPQQQNSGRCVKYQDLPYMGEMTLANSKPRRGRKPKKADICHLIYKNYGTILPGTPSSKNFAEKDLLDKKDNHVINDEECFSNRSSIQNKLISSLLEKRLTQEIKKTIGPTVSKREQRGSTVKCDQNEPLNLCIRDLNHLKIRFMKKPDNTYIMSGMKSKQESNELVRDSPSPPVTATATVPPQSLFENILSASSPDLSQIPENGAAPPGYVYWPNAGVFIHPMALQQQMMYYQRMASNSSYTLPSHSPRPPPETPPPLPQLSPSREVKKIVVKKEKKVEVAANETEKIQTDQKTKRNASSVSCDRTPTKRKRSAIFIPPIPPESTTNPTTEVSICKFKFTGGAKPSLQEKKMLSVDSGGNFRYYSGTGDKSMRGYEFFPRETLQQQISNSHGSSTGAFLQASGEKIYPIAPVDFASASKSTDFLLSPEIPSAQLQELNSKHKKRKSRKSIQREKLEQTFKEKGFLIQTQQLESAEGATYCKFRQLRKFTRYLFRSWKDYLPGNVTELQESGKDVSGCGEGDIVEEDVDNLSRHSGSDIGASSNVQS